MKNKIIKKLKIKFIAIMMAVVLIFLIVIMAGLYISNKNNFREKSLEILRASLNSNERDMNPMRISLLLLLIILIYVRI